MKNFLTRAAMLVLFLAAVCLMYSAVTLTFSSILWNIVLGIIAFYMFLRSMDLADMLNGYGKYSNKRDTDEHPADNPGRPMSGGYRRMPYTRADYMNDDPLPDDTDFIPDEEVYDDTDEDM